MSASQATPNPNSSDAEDFRINFEIESRLNQIRLVRAALGGVLTHLDVAESDIHSLSLAVTEIINNSMEHGYQGDEDQQVAVRVHVRKSEVEVDIIDNAPPFPEEHRYRLTNDLNLLEDPSEEWTMRGHGLQIVRKIVDSITLVARNGQNCMTLRKTVAIGNN
jgi:serine/threonine-protein kinase RsbW